MYYIEVTKMSFAELPTLDRYTSLAMACKDISVDLDMGGDAYKSILNILTSHLPRLRGRVRIITNAEICTPSVDDLSTQGDCEVFRGSHVKLATATRSKDTGKTSYAQSLCQVHRDIFGNSGCTQDTHSAFLEQLKQRMVKLENSHMKEQSCQRAIVRQKWDLLLRGISCGVQSKKENIEIKQIKSIEQNCSHTSCQCLDCDNFFVCLNCSKSHANDHLMVHCDRLTFVHVVLPMIVEIVSELYNIKIEESKDDVSTSSEQSPNTNDMESAKPNIASGVGLMTEICVKKEISDESPSREWMTEDAKEFPEVITKLELDQLKQRWMRKCNQIWRDQIRKSKVDVFAAKNDKMSRFVFWRMCMKRCWDEWLLMMEESSIKPSQLPMGWTESNMNNWHGHRHHNLRHRWIEECWKIWTEEAQEIRNISNPNVCRPLPGFVPLMTKSWHLMLKQMQTKSYEAFHTHEDYLNLG